MKALGYTKDQAPGAISPYLPDFIADDITDVDFSRLKELGVTHLLLDLDGTLRKAYSRKLELEVIEVFQKLKDSNAFEDIIIASNNNFSLQKFAKPIGARIFQPFWHNSRLIRKPHPLFFSHVLSEIGIEPSQAAMIGDRLRSDIIGANRAGIRTVLLKQRGSGYWFDRILLSNIRERRHYERALSARRLHLPSTVHYLRDALESAGLPSKHIARIANDATRSTSFVAHDNKQRIFIKLVNRQHTFVNRVYKFWKRFTLQPMKDRLADISPAEVLEHEAQISTQATTAGVATPKVHQLIDMGDGRFALVSEFLDGTTLNELPRKLVTDTLVSKAWQQIMRLHKANIAHGDLRAANIMVNGARTWIIDFDSANDTPSPQQLAKDTVEFLVSTAGIIGAKRAVKNAARYIPANELRTFLPLLTHQSLTSATRKTTTDRLLHSLKKSIDTNI